MLPETEQENPRAAETIIRRLDGMAIKKLTGDQTALLMSVYLSKDAHLKEFEKEISEKYPLYNSIHDQLNKMYSFSMDTRSKMVLASWPKRPAHLTIYLMYLQYQCRDMTINYINLDILTKIFPIGIFEEFTLNKIWSNQIVEKGTGYSVNLFDYRQAMQSLVKFN